MQTRNRNGATRRDVLRGGARVALAIPFVGLASSALLAGCGSGDEAPSKPPAVETDVGVESTDEPGRARVGAGVGETTPRATLPTGVIRVVEEDGSLAPASVYTTAEPVWVRAEAKHLGSRRHLSLEG